MAELSKITLPNNQTYYLRDRNYCTCSTEAGTKAKTASLEGFVLTTGSVVNVRFANSNTASDPTLNINDTGAHAIMKYGSTAPGVTAASSWYAGSIITLIYDGTYWVMVDFNVTGMYIASYGNSTYAEVLEAYRDNKIIYCRASSNSNPATGNQLRMAFLAYINDQVTPTNFEFQYYRSVNTLSITQQGDQVYVYKLDKTSGWSVTIRQAYSKIANGTGLSESYNSSTRTLTLNHSNSVTAQTTQAIYPIKIDAQGHINSYGSAITPLTANSTLDATKLSGTVPRASLPSNYGTCSTAANVAAKTVSLSGFVLTTGSVVNVRFDNSNTASDPTLNINDTGAYAIKRYGTTAASTAVASSWQAGSVVTLIFDGTYWMIGHGYDANTTYSAMSASEATTGTATTGRLIGAKVLHDKINSLIPDPMTAEEATAGTSTTARTISAKILQDKIQDEIEEMKQTNAEMGQGYGVSGNSIVTGSNLLPYPYAETTKTVNGITFTDNGDGSITMNGTATGRAQFKFCESFDYSSGSVYDVAFLNENNELVNFYNYNTTRLQINTTVGDGYSTDDFMSGFSQPISSVMVVTTEDTFNNFTFYPIITFYDSTHPQSFNWEPYTQSLIVSLPYYELVEGGIVAVKMNIDVPAGVGMNINSTGVLPIKYKGSAITSNIISSGDTVTFVYSNGSYYLISIDSGGSGSYTPQTNASLGQGYGEVDSITRTGKNMLPYPYEDTTKTINGITFTDNGDGTITANGTVDSGYNAVFVLADSPLDVINPLEENVILSGCPEGGSSSTYCIYCQTQSVISRDYGSGVNLGYQIDYAAIIIYSDTTVNNLTFSPMIRLSTESADWEAYSGPEVSVTLPSYELSEGGIVAIKTDDEITRGSLLNINDTGAKQIFNQLRPLKDNEICSGDTATFIYSNNIYYLLSVDRWQNLATPSSPGLMSASDKDKLDTVARNANNYYLPTASANILGGVKVGTNLSISSGVLSATDTTYESKAAVNGGTDLSLVTTGEKFKWNMDDYCTCSTGASTADKTASLDGFVLDTGVSVKVKFTNTNTAANPTLNINSTGAKPIMQYGTTVAGTTATDSWDDGAVVEFVYDGTNWVMQGRNTIDAVSKSAGGTFEDNVAIIKPSTTTSDTGWCGLTIGNSTPTGTVGASMGHIDIYGRSSYKHSIMSAYTMTADRDIVLPDVGGTLMTNQGGTFTGHIYVDKPSSGTWQGYSSIVLGNDKAVETNGNSRGQIMIYGTGTNFATINADPTADRTISLPDASGTIALDTAASQSAAGLMSAADKTKLDGIAAGANAYTLPTASASALGGIKVGTNLSINASTGVLSATDTTYSAATQSAAGLMSAADKKKLDGVATGANAYSLPTASASTLGGIKVGTNLSISNGVLSATNTTYSAATQSAAGLMSAADKKKLDGVATGANAYSLPTASASTLGGIKVGTNLSISSGVLSATNTTYSAATQSAAGLMSAADKKKLDAITPYPTAYSTSGNWKRLTFSNKIQILWCTQTINGVNVTSGWGSGYYARIGYWTFPWAFNAVPTVVASLQGASGGDVILEYDGSCTASATQTYYAFRPASGSNINITVGIIAFGTYS